MTLRLPDDIITPMLMFQLTDIGQPPPRADVASRAITPLADSHYADAAEY